jgi:hypothetical protein
MKTPKRLAKIGVCVQVIEFLSIHRHAVLHQIHDATNQLNFYQRFAPQQFALHTLSSESLPWWDLDSAFTVLTTGRRKPFFRRLRTQNGFPLGDSLDKSVDGGQSAWQDAPQTAGGIVHLH